jgi:hypothetical protein
VLRGFLVFHWHTAAAQPQQPAGEDVAHFAQMRWEVGIGGIRWHGWDARSCRPTEKNSENSFLEKCLGKKSGRAKVCVSRRGL